MHSNKEKPINLFRVLVHHVKKIFVNNTIIIDLTITTIRINNGRGMVKTNSMNYVHCRLSLGISIYSIVYRSCAVLAQNV